MSSIEANITISAEDGTDLSRIISDIQVIISNLNGQSTQINIVDTDDFTVPGNISAR